MRKIYLKLLLLSLILIPINAYAETGTLSASCTPASPKPGDTVTCTLNGTSDVTVIAAEADVNLGTGATITGIEYTNKWIGEYENNNRINTHTLDGYSNSFTIGTITIKINDNATPGNISLGFSNVIFTNVSGGQEFDGNGSLTTITVAENQEPVVEKGLRTLICTSCTNGENLSPPLSDSNRSYTLMLKPTTTTFSLSATAKNSSDSITYKYINGNNAETVNPNNITFKTSGGQSAMMLKIYVGSGENEVEYVIAVTKTTSEKGKLATLTVGGQNVSLNDNKFDYQVTLDSVDSYQINATVADSTKFEVYSPNVGRVLSGEGAYEIVVRPIDSTAGYEGSTYIVSISKKGSSVTPVPTTRPTPSGNPQTGEGGIVLLGFVLIISLITTVYLYKRNNEYTN